jgi:6-phosphofructokinase 1
VGRDAVSFAMLHGSGTVVLQRKPGRRYACTTALAPLDKVARLTKAMDRRFINRAGNDITAAFVAYAAPLAGKLPVIGHLRGR